MANAQSVHRCGSQYSDKPCTGGKVVDVSPAVRSLDSTSGASGGQVFLCVHHGGRRFWSSTHCREQQALVERIESVPAHLPWSEQVQIAEQKTRQGYSTQRQQMQARGAASAGVTAPGNGTRQNCSHWNEQVARYDAMARQPQSPATQGWIAERRKETRDAQFRAGC